MFLKQKLCVLSFQVGMYLNLKSIVSEQSPHTNLNHLPVRFIVIDNINEPSLDELWSSKFSSWQIWSQGRIHSLVLAFCFSSEPLVRSPALLLHMGIMHGDAEKGRAISDNKVTCRSFVLQVKEGFGLSEWW